MRRFLKILILRCFFTGRLVKYSHLRTILTSILEEQLMTRVVMEPQTKFGEINIADIKFHPKSRDDIPKILKGLQYIYVTTELRQTIFSLLEQHILPKVNKQNGRPGMALWKILVMGVLRLDLSYDYDRLTHLVNYDSLVRKFLGHGLFDENDTYEFQTIKDNVGLLTPELLDLINQEIVKSGHQLLKKKETEALRGRCDSFVLKTNVHFPTDINLLFDAVRKAIELVARLSEQQGLTEWRQSKHNIKQAKRLMRQAQQKKRARGKTEEQNQKQKKALIKAHKEYIEVVGGYLDKVTATIKTLENQGNLSMTKIAMVETIKGFIVHGNRQVDQIERRVVRGEKILHEEKVFSLFQPHTEWISKGKAGVPVELGVRVCIVEDQHQFILHHKVMEKQTDKDVAVPIIQETKIRFEQLQSCSFDKAFHSPENQQQLGETLDVVGLKRKGKLSKEAQAIESSEEFCIARKKHSAVESAINALTVHGLDMCPDHGIEGLKRYVALAIVARNIHRIGDILTKREQKAAARKRQQYLTRDGALKLAA